MLKKVFIKNLNRNLIFERLNKGEKLYNGSNKYFYAICNNIMVAYEDGKLFAINPIIYFDDPLYFLEAYADPEADESCIGKLCKFWDNNEFDKTDYYISTLDKIIGSKFIDPVGQIWNHCKPLSKADIKKLTKEN